MVRSAVSRCQLSKTLASTVTDALLNGIARKAGDDNSRLNNALRLLAKWRCELIKNTLIQREGTVVLDGPLKGLDFLEKSAEGCHVAKLLGVYEQPLHRHLQPILSGAYGTVVNLGCAEGYYAVGFAKAAPDITSYAFDTDPSAQSACRELAEKNGVDHRVIVCGEFSIADFEPYREGPVIVFCDVEGAEEELLDIEKAPTLANLDLIVESHECIRPGITNKLIDRFSTSHTVELVRDNGMRDLTKVPNWFLELSHLDQLLATWEWRSGPTPWLIMKSRTRHA